MDYDICLWIVPLHSKCLVSSDNDFEKSRMKGQRGTEGGQGEQAGQVRGVRMNSRGKTMGQ